MGMRNVKSGFFNNSRGGIDCKGRPVQCLPMGVNEKIEGFKERKMGTEDIRQMEGRSFSPIIRYSLPHTGTLCFCRSLRRKKNRCEKKYQPNDLGFQRAYPSV